MASGNSRSPIDLAARFRAAIQGYWVTRSKQQKKQTGRGGAVDAGLRSAVTGGAQMAKLEELISDILCEAGMLRESIRTRIALELPGYFKPEKKWDLVVVADGQPHLEFGKHGAMCDLVASRRRYTCAAILRFLGVRCRMEDKTQKIPCPSPFLRPCVPS
jgi:hypothetical protein